MVAVEFVRTQQLAIAPDLGRERRAGFFNLPRELSIFAPFIDPRASSTLKTISTDSASTRGSQDRQPCGGYAGGESIAAIMTDSRFRCEAP